MIAGGHIPVPGQRSDHADTPRVGDGYLRVDQQGRVVAVGPRVGQRTDDLEELDDRARVPVADQQRHGGRLGVRSPAYARELLIGPAEPVNASGLPVALPEKSWTLPIDGLPYAG